MRALNTQTCFSSCSSVKLAAAPRRAQNAAPKPSRRTSTIASAATGGGGGGPSLLQKLGRVFSEKATADIERVFKGASKTREKLGVSVVVSRRKEKQNKRRLGRDQTLSPSNEKSKLYLISFLFNLNLSTSTNYSGRRRALRLLDPGEQRGCARGA